MMTPRTVQQLLQVFRHFRDNHTSGISLHRSYNAAVRTVAKNHDVTYQTIGDGCRRRLRLTEINELYELLDAWVNGNPSGLVRQLKDNSDPAAHADIEQFFSSGPSSTIDTKKSSLKTPLREDSETFSFRLPAPDARMLKALAELEGVSVGELTAREVATAVRDRMTVVARRIMKKVR